ncbi:hydrogenase formation protein HypD [Heliobacillus mobilis]|uniref:Hydrogenase formation protein HypD n=1 Tax=Heliobacterium mobile TaxID=28064 RepID=A0A6I3SIR9_HELMO|nr:hydrogenase formation protein HypD [Heliobacterium mobile]MTV48799.1 hydrogenase formation protein HypD [Heliobacterium mobile]
MHGQVLKQFRDPDLGRRMAESTRQRLQRLADKLGRRPRFMEFCGTHTAAISRTGVRGVLKTEVDLLSGPGCPVCVSDYSDIDRAIAFSTVPGAIVATFGDMMKVPGSRTTLQEEKARGADVRVVYSSLDALQLARENPDRPVIFLGVGFETTAPTAVMTLEQAVREDIRNFYLYSMHKTTPPPTRALLPDPELQIDGIILPGHVSMILGRKAWDFLPSKLQRPGVVAGFEPVELLAAIDTLADMLLTGNLSVVNQYGRAVREEGNLVAQQAMDKYYSLVDGPWRGLGTVAGSVLKLKQEYAPWDAEACFAVNVPPTQIPKGCICGEIVKGKQSPFDCALFGKGCDPIRPVGPCMVSSEGTCATYYKYERM